MFGQVALLCKLLPTSLAIVPDTLMVFFLVCVQASIISISLITLVTLHPLLGMDYSMDSQTLLGRKTLPTLVAHVRPLPGHPQPHHLHVLLDLTSEYMAISLPLVALQLLFSVQSNTAIHAFVWLIIPCVLLHVLAQSVCTRKF